MSTNAMEMALEALEVRCGTNADERKPGGVIEVLRAAIRQAESEPVGEPRARVELIKTGGNAGLSTRIIELDSATSERLRPGDLLYTHPAPGVPDGWHGLAQRCLTAMQLAVHFYTTGRGRPPDQTCRLEIEELTTMLAASPAQKGGE